MKKKSLFIAALAITISGSCSAQKGEVTSLQVEPQLTASTSNSTDYLNAMKQAGSGSYSQLVVETSAIKGSLVEPLGLLTFRYEMVESKSSEDTKNLTTSHTWNLIVDVELWGENIANGSAPKGMDKSIRLSFSKPVNQDVIWAMNSPSISGCWGTFIWCKDFDKPSYLGRAQPFSGVELYGMIMVGNAGTLINNAINATSAEASKKILTSSEETTIEGGALFADYIQLLKNAKVSAEDIMKPIARSSQSVQMQLKAIAGIKHSSELIKE